MAAALGEPIGNSATGRTRTDHNIVELFGRHTGYMLSQRLGVSLTINLE